MTKKQKYAKLFDKSKGIKLDLGCGSNKSKGFVGMDIRKIKGVDIVHDVQKFPWPIPDSSCWTVLMSHLWEHIEPKNRIRLMDELWRIIKPDGQLLLSAPYFSSFGAHQDPTHYYCPNEATFQYFDPFDRQFNDAVLYGIYQPKPWHLVRNAYDAEGMYGNVEVILEPEKDNKGRPINKAKIKQSRIDKVKKMKEAKHAKR